MIVGSTKEDLVSEKRVSLTPDTAKSIIGLGLKICIQKNYAEHIGIKDEEYKAQGAEIVSDEKITAKESTLFNILFLHL